MAFQVCWKLWSARGTRPATPAGRGFCPWADRTKLIDDPTKDAPAPVEG